MATSEPTEQEIPPGTRILRRYRAVGKLAQGGMAEVYLARQVGPAGYQKLVVIKRVRPHLATDKDFVAMFVNEARLAAMINHPNVVQIFDLGQEGSDWFLAMEYLDGRDMLQVGRACRSHNKAVPFDVTARIIADACAGLEYAHNLKGTDGQKLDLVHRDMSPENVLITFEGQVKVVDFGIAKAADNTLQTQAGQIKGKLGYVAPEAILGKTLDARADIFAVGATLYLFLCGRPAFAGSTPMEIFERSLKPPTAPMEVNPRVPPALDQICMKALAQDRDKRFRTAGEVRAALEGYLTSTGRPLGPPQLSQFMRILFPTDKDPIRQRIDKLLSEAATWDADEPAPRETAMTKKPRSVSVPANKPIPAHSATLRTGVLSDDHDEPTAIVSPERMRPASPQAVDLPAGGRLRAAPPKPPARVPRGNSDTAHDDPRTISSLPAARSIPPITASSEVRTEISNELAAELIGELSDDEAASTTGGGGGVSEVDALAVGTLEGETAPRTQEATPSQVRSYESDRSDFLDAPTVGVTEIANEPRVTSSGDGPSIDFVPPPRTAPEHVSLSSSSQASASLPDLGSRAPSMMARVGMLALGAATGGFVLLIALALTGTLAPLLHRVGLEDLALRVATLL